MGVFLGLVWVLCKSLEEYTMSKACFYRYITRPSVKEYIHW